MGAIASVHVGNDLPLGEGGNDAPPAEEAAANMHLIAAAPDLLAALMHIADAEDEDDEWDGRDKFRFCRETARVAILKATA